MNKPETVYVPAGWTYEDIRVRVYTGQFIRDYSSQDKKAGRYRSGMLTKHGDIEEHEWVAYAEELVRRNGDEELFRRLKNWYRDTINWFENEKDLRKYALVCLIDGIPNNPLWVDYVAFNSKYRPELLRDENAGGKNDGNGTI